MYYIHQLNTNFMRKGLKTNKFINIEKDLYSENEYKSFLFREVYSVNNLWSVS